MMKIIDGEWWRQRSSCQNILNAVFSNLYIDVNKKFGDGSACIVHPFYCFIIEIEDFYEYDCLCRVVVVILKLRVLRRLEPFFFVRTRGWRHENFMIVWEDLCFDICWIWLVGVTLQNFFTKNATITDWRHFNVVVSYMWHVYQFYYLIGDVKAHR